MLFVFCYVQIMHLLKLNKMRTDFFFLQNLRNEEQVAIIQASTVLSLAEKVSPYQCIELGELLEK